jgi:hypothetical protein
MDHENVTKSVCHITCIDFVNPTTDVFHDVATSARNAKLLMRVPVVK